MLQNQSSKTEILHVILRVGMRIIKGVLDKGQGTQVTAGWLSLLLLRCLKRHLLMQKR